MKNRDDDKVHELDSLYPTDRIKVARQLQRVYVNLSNSVLKKMEKRAGLDGRNYSNNKILQTYIVNTLNRE